MFRTLSASALVSLCTCLSWATFTPQYETYTSYSSDATKIYQTVVVDGTTSGDCFYPCNCNQYGCQQCTIANCPSVHTPKIDNVLGGAGGWSTGPQYNMFSYMSYQTTTSITATDGHIYVGSTEGTIYCAAAAGLILDVATQDYTAKNPNCGSNNGAVVIVNAPPRVAKCDASTINIASSSVGGSGYSYITSINVNTSTDNTLLLDLLGGPSKSSVCGGSTGVSCYDQNYKAAVPNQYTGKSGNIKWNYNIFCGAKLNPDIYGTVPQKISCP